MTCGYNFLTMDIRDTHDQTKKRSRSLPSPGIFAHGSTGQKHPWSSSKGPQPVRLCLYSVFFFLMTWINLYKYLKSAIYCHHLRKCCCHIVQLQPFCFQKKTPHSTGDTLSVKGISKSIGAWPLSPAVRWTGLVIFYNQGRSSGVGIDVPLCFTSPY